MSRGYVPSKTKAYQIIKSSSRHPVAMFLPEKSHLGLEKEKLLREKLIFMKHKAIHFTIHCL